MSALVNYRKTGRLAFAGWAWWQFGKAVTGGEPVKAAIAGSIAVEATAGIFYPEPILTAIGYGILQSMKGTLTLGRIAATKWFTLLNRFWALPLAKRNVIVFTLMTPFMLQETQTRAMEEGELGINEELGRAMWQAQAVPDTERLQVRIGTFGGGLPF